MRSLPLRVHLKVIYGPHSHNSEQVLMTKYLKILLLCATAVDLISRCAIESVKVVTSFTLILIQYCVICHVFIDIGHLIWHSPQAHDSIYMCCYLFHMWKN